MFPKTDEWGRMNQRRVELIRNKNREGLNEAEGAELDKLQTLSQIALEKAFPPPTTMDDEIDRLRSKFR
jgi:hypothetical protein